MDFIDDEEKIKDLLLLSKEEFLNTYSYLTEKEYENTTDKIIRYVRGKVKAIKKQNITRRENAEQVNKERLKYYHKNKEQINKRRRELYKLKKESVKNVAN